MKKWMVLNKHRTKNIEHITEREIIKILLKNRGMVKRKDIEEFLHPSLDQLNFTNVKIRKKELDKAVKRVKQAIKNKESIVVYTDYDVDGLCSGVIVWETLYKLGSRVMPYVPNRIEEGYGLSKKGIDFIKKEYGVSLIITVDHGVSASERIDYARSLGIETIIVDHHLLSDKIPKIKALVHTTKLCATGVAWIFCNYLNAKLKKPPDKLQDLDLVALATIADLVPLTGANRTLAIYGLQQLNKTSRIGLKTLIEVLGLTKGELGIFEVGYILAPRINAMGRLTHAIDVLRLLCTKDRERARNLSAVLDSTNRERQLQMGESILHARTIIGKRSEERGKLLFIADTSYHQGIIGLVAGKLVEEFYLPAIVISKGREYSKASARSINGFNIVEFLRRAGDLLEDVGGHPMAAGFTVKTENIIKLKKRLDQLIEKELNEESLAQVLKIDMEINLSDINQELYKNIDKLSPFGVGNPQPTFVSYNVKVVGAQLVGRDKQHLKLMFRSNSDNIFQAIGFGMAKFYNQITFDNPIDIAYTIEEENWNSRSGLQLKLKDVKVPDK